MKEKIKIIFKVPYLKDLEPNMCVRYARIVAKKLTGAEYNPADAWEFSKRNKIVAELNGNLEDFVEKMTAKKTIVTFYDPKSEYNKKGRKVTHSALFLGCENGKIIFAEQTRAIQQITTYSKMQKRGLIAKQILAPKN